ncbi:hypothetical protein KGA66_17285 [Actinocrinis puniceicyclus]|uniref:EcsC protein family protein n=1 Tax=Actinocrinis puniceicyclus TaxID=977794 RepID=A0A8J7WSG5_9ACTN|nr:hypothetical protein [Actinocrinis puniceicyclus]MBS2964815.1 hypothetical protein [Actinocrinis puniceicyclus]
MAGAGEDDVGAERGGGGAERAPDAQVAAIVGELATTEDAAPQRLKGPLSRLAGVLRRGFSGGGRGAQLTGQWLVDQVLAMAPRLPVRDQATLWRQHPGLSADELADVLIEGAARASGAIGGAVGVWAVLPVAPLFAVEVATETVAVVGIEIKLIAELHEVYGLRAPGSGVERMISYTSAWADRRGVSLAPGTIALAIGPALRGRLTRRLTRRAARSTISLGPLLSGAAAGAWANRRETRRLGRTVRAQLQRAVSEGRLLEG